MYRIFPRMHPPRLRLRMLPRVLACILVYSAPVSAEEALRQTRGLVHNGQKGERG